MDRKPLYRGLDFCKGKTQVYMKMSHYHIGAGTIGLPKLTILESCNRRYRIHSSRYPHFPSGRQGSLLFRRFIACAVSRRLRLVDST